MADDIATIAGRIKTQLSEFDKAYAQAAHDLSKESTDSAESVEKAQQKINDIWGDWQKLQQLVYLKPPNRQADEAAYSTGKELASRLENLNNLESTTHRDTSNAAWWNLYSDTRSQTQVKIDAVGAYVKNVGNHVYAGSDGNSTSVATSLDQQNKAPSAAPQAPGARPTVSLLPSLDQKPKLSLEQGQTTADFYKATQKGYQSPDRSVAERLKRKEMDDNKLKQNHVTKTSLKDAMEWTERGYTIGDDKNSALAKNAAIFGPDRARKIENIQEEFIAKINGMDHADPNFKQKFDEELNNVRKQVADVRDAKRSQFKNQSANELVNERLWNADWGARMKLAELAATNDADKTAITQLKQMGMLVRAGNGNAYTTGASVTPGMS